MESHADKPLKVGDTVRYNAYGVGTAALASGIITQRISEHSWRVQWNNAEKPTSHRSHSLERVANSGRLFPPA
jgi:hypothetical protein